MYVQYRCTQKLGGPEDLAMYSHNMCCTLVHSIYHAHWAITHWIRVVGTGAMCGVWCGKMSWGVWAAIGRVTPPVLHTTVQSIYHAHGHSVNDYGWRCKHGHNSKHKASIVKDTCRNTSPRAPKGRGVPLIARAQRQICRNKGHPSLVTSWREENCSAGGGDMNAHFPTPPLLGRRAGTIVTECQRGWYFCLRVR